MADLDALGPIDGRYRKKVESLGNFFSERGLMKCRLIVEGEYLIFLSKNSKIAVRNFSEEEISLIRRIYDLSLEDAEIIKKIEMQGYNEIKATNHDVKAIEYFMKLKLKDSSLADCLEWTHFALTSEDVNNLAYALMVRDALESVILPELDKVYEKVQSFAILYRNLPMLARTHGQPASPTTFGKEFRVFGSRLRVQIEKLRDFDIFTKLNGASGNYNAHFVAYPNIDWIEFTRDFIENFNLNREIRLKPNFLTTQIEPHDTYAELFHIFIRINNILIDFNRDIWRYISDSWLVQKPVEGEVGSSTMPHKINPIDFENSEGNLGLANSLFEFFANKLPISRLQRDLSDSTVERNFGVAFGHSFLAYQSLLKGLSKVFVDEAKVLQELDSHPEVISEAIQTILRREGVEMPYEKLKELTRGRKVIFEDFTKFIEELNVSNELKEELRKITPRNYVGIADKLVDL